MSTTVQLSAPNVSSTTSPQRAVALAPLPVHRQRLEHGLRLDRHRHVGAYAALLLAGSYVEAGDSGRRLLRPGDAVLHSGFSAHHNSVGREGAVVLNLPLYGHACVEGFFRVPNPDAVVLLAETDEVHACALLLRTSERLPPECLDWRDALHADLASNPTLSLGQWARSQRMALETLSRGFRSAFGVTPKRMRFEHRARQALLRVMGSTAPLTHVALDAGFADQAHMSHAIAALTGRSAGHWRGQSSRDKTGAAERGTLRG
jgi:AraC-like DNA-binding protein